jgi:uncharacterized Zn finger protein
MPQCGSHELNVYKLSETGYLCECQECGIYGRGDSETQALENTACVIDDDLDWRDFLSP